MVSHLAYKWSDTSVVPICIVSEAEHLQEKADIVSAFCVLTGLQLSHGKLRRVVQNVMPNNVLQEMIVYRHPWQPCKVAINTTEPTEYLGGIYDVHSSGTSALELALETADTHCNVIRFSPVPPTFKVIVATASTLAKL